MTISRWHETLSRCGFSGADAVFQDYEEDICNEQAIIISTASAPSTVYDEADFTIFANMTPHVQQELGSELAVSLKAAGYRCGSVVSLEKALTENLKPSTIVISLLELESPYLADLDLHRFADIRSVLLRFQKILWVTCAGGTDPSLPHLGLVNGLSRSLRAEHGQGMFVTAALEKHRSTQQHVKTLSKILKVADFESSAEGCEPAYREVNGMLEIDRLVEAPALSQRIHEVSLPHRSLNQQFGAGPPLEMRIATPTALDSIYFAEDESRQGELKPDDVEIQVKAVGLNFKDCLVALGRVPSGAIGNELPV